MSLEHLVSKPLWSPRAEFPPSRMIGEAIFACGEGIYLLTNPDAGGGDPVYAVGWARSDFWAMHTWDLGFSAHLTAPEAQWAGPPSLRFLGRPEVLSFAGVLAFEEAQPAAQPGEAKWPVVPVPTYRAIDDTFIHVEIGGADEVKYFYASAEPLPDDLPVALEIWLPDQD